MIDLRDVKEGDAIWVHGHTPDGTWMQKWTVVKAGQRTVRAVRAGNERSWHRSGAAAGHGFGAACPWDEGKYREALAEEAARVAQASAKRAVHALMSDLQGMTPMISAEQVGRIRAVVIAVMCEIAGVPE